MSGGSLSQALRAGFIAMATAAAFNAVGDFTGHNPAFASEQYFENVAGHAAVGCLSAVASGGKCGAGAAGAAVGAAGAPFLVGQNLVTGTAASAVLGGLGSVAAGGKFADGAVTASFGYLFNATAGRMAGASVGGWAAGVAGAGTGPFDPLVILGGRWLGGQIGSALEDWAVGAWAASNGNVLESRSFGKDDKKEMDARARNPETGKEECFFCGKEVGPPSGNGPDAKRYDHWWPWSKGGASTSLNGEVLCNACNGPGGKWFKAPWNWR